MFLKQCLFLFLIIILGSSPISGQKNLVEVRSDRKVLEKELSLSKASLENLSDVESLEAYDLLKIHITQNKKLAQIFNEQNELLTEHVKYTRTLIDSLAAEIKVREGQYQEVLKMLYRQKLLQNDWTLLFSSETFQQLWVRYRYTKQFQRFVKKEKEQLTTLKRQYEETNQSINEELIKIKHNKRDLELALLHLSEKEENLRKVAQKLRKEKRKVSNKLNKKEALKKLSAQNIQKEDKDQFSLNPKITRPKIDDDKPKNIAFISQKGRLPWPVQNGFITERFGRRPHEIVPNVWVENNGVGIYTLPGENVKVVHKGNVKETLKVSDDGYIVIVEHGDYLTSYFTLASIFVSRGDVVNEGQILGSISKSSTSPPILQFEIWKGYDKIDPEKMLIKKR